MPAKTNSTQFDLHVSKYTITNTDNTANKYSRAKGIWPRPPTRRNVIITERDTETHTSWEEGTDHEAEVDGGHGEDEQEDEDQRGVTVGQHCSVRAHLKKHSSSAQLWCTEKHL